MKHRLLAMWCGVLSGLIIPVMALAEDEKVLNGRVEGFSKGIKVEPSSSAPNWLILIVLAGICLAVLFKDAKRSHMD